MPQEEGGFAYHEVGMEKDGERYWKCNPTVSKIPIDISWEILWTDHRLSVTKTRFRCVPTSSSSNTMIAPLLHLQLLRRWEHGVMAMVTGSSYEKVDRCSYRKMGFKRERENGMPIGMKTITSRLLLSKTSGRRFH